MTVLFDPQKIRELFPVFQQESSETKNDKPVIHLNNAATTHKPLAVIEALSSFYARDAANVHRASPVTGTRLTEAYERSRSILQSMLNARFSEEIIWTKGATESINLVACSWGQSKLKAGDEIVLLVSEHHANIVPWQRVAGEKGAVIKVVPLETNATVNVDAFSDCLSDKTRLVSIAHVANATGVINPVRKMIRRAREAGAVVLVDGAQAAPHLDIDVQDLDCDFYVISGHKMYGPNGIGVLYGRQALLESMPVWQTGGGMVEKVAFDEETIFNPPPFRFEAGTPNIPAVLGLAKAVGFIQSMDRERVQKHEEKLLLKIHEGLSSIKGLSLLGPKEGKAGSISFYSQTYHHQDLSMLLAEKGVVLRSGHHCAMPLMSFFGLKGTLRASVAMYNTEQDIDIFLNALDDVLRDSHFYFNRTLSKQSEDEDSGLLSLESQSAGQVYEEIRQSKHWTQKQRAVMRLGKQLPAMPERYKTEEFLIPGCESRVWLKVDYDEKNHTLRCHADSDSSLMKGLVILLLLKVNGKSPEMVLDDPPETLFDSLGLQRFLSETRSAGLKTMANRISVLARAYLQEYQG